MNTGLTRRFVKVLIAALAIGLLIAAGVGVFFYRYIHAYDDSIAIACGEYGLDPELIRAVIWQESHFNRKRIGAHGEIGLMQITEAAVRDWAQASSQPLPLRQDLFAPEINIRAGAWYLRRALRYWSAKPNPLPYALAEYNAGRSNTIRWASNDRNDPNIFWNGITFKSTRLYVRGIVSNYKRNTETGKK